MRRREFVGFLAGSTVAWPLVSSAQSVGVRKARIADRNWDRGIAEEASCHIRTLTVTAARSTYDYAKAHGVDATMRVLDPEETGAEHCQHDNPTIGQEVLADWLADRFGMDQKAMLKTSFNSLVRTR